MNQIRENIWQITADDFENPSDRGYYSVEGLGEVLMDQADLNYISNMKAKGMKPVFFVSKSAALNGALVVVSRQHPA
jgi:hypothetical protein